MTATALIISTSNPPRGALEKKILKTNVFANTIHCSSGEEAIAELGKQKIDMIFWAFGTIDAPTDWLTTLRIKPAWADLPILIFTKEGEHKQRLRGLELGACDSVTFVTPTAELTARIRGHLMRTEQITQLRNRRAELAKMALSDPLTGLGNRTSFDLRLGQEISRSQRTGTPFSLMLVDLDHFKWFNDCYGHQAGDTILKAVSGALTKTARNADIVCRYGGEEFAIILPGATATSANNFAQRLHQQLALLSTELWHNEAALTASIGLTCFDGTRKIGSYELIGEADSALYRAKNNGRNRTESCLSITPKLPLRFDNDFPVTTALHA